MVPKDKGGFMDRDTRVHSGSLGEPVSSREINSWRRGFTPQAEIWNGRMAMFALAVTIGTLVILRF